MAVHLAAFANLQRLQIGETADGRPISPLVGEMSGRTEGGAVELDLRSASLARHPPPHRRPLRRVGRPALRPYPRRRPDRLHPRGRTPRRSGNPPRPAAHAAAHLPVPHLGRGRPGCRAGRRLHHRCRRPAPFDRRMPGLAGLRLRPYPGSRHRRRDRRRGAAEGLGFDLHVSGCAKRCAKPGHDGADAARPCRRRRARPRSFGRSANRSCRKGRRRGRDWTGCRAARARKRSRAKTRPPALRRLGPARLAAIFRQAS